VCVCVCSGIWYPHTAVYVLFKTQNWKKKANDITKGGVGRDKRDTASGARQLCVCVLVVWRCPFDDAKAPRSNYFVLFSLFSFYSVFFIFQS
jgi:G:T-mismatch repair DNA endonuclease (very short patch repair protein)